MKSKALVTIKRPSEIPYREVGRDDDGEPIYRREMTAEEIKERLDLNVANTAERQRRWAIEEARKRNGER
jgi:hypothetical protein